jgi:demethylmenaquinone methyltransferase/2-methoxy-6-polyprenyl-1,4-benzoquinol methylase
LDRTSAESAQRKRYRREILSYFHKHSRNYDLSATALSLGTIGRVRTRTVEMLALKRGHRVLDICTGTGETALYLLRAGYRAAGIDFSLPMLREAVKKGLHTKAPFIHGDALYLPFCDNSFHGATISFGLHEMPQEVMEDILRESARLLVPGGKLVVTDWNLPPQPRSLQPPHRCIRDPLLSRLPGDRPGMPHA